MKLKTKIGDVFSVVIDENTVKFFQLVAFDLSQLNSDVIRSFRRPQHPNDPLDVDRLIASEVEFYAHCMVDIGLKLSCWKKVGNSPEIGDVHSILFRNSSDYGDPSIKVSDNWWVWRINEEHVRVGKLQGENRKAEVGIVFNHRNIVNRMKHGIYNGFYPGYE